MSTDKRKYYDEEFGSEMFLPELRLMQSRSGPVEEGNARVGDLYKGGRVHEEFTATLTDWGGNRLLWPQGAESVLCEAIDDKTGERTEAGDEKTDAEFGGACMECPMREKECTNRMVLKFEDEDGEEFYLLAYGRSYTPAFEIVQAARARDENDPMKVKISSRKGGRYGTYSYVFSAL